MDVCMVMIEKNEDHTKKITFTGAKRSLFLGANGKVYEVKGDNRSIGGATRKNKAFKPFNNKVIELPKGSYLYLSTDGLVDQQSRYKNKFGTKKFLEILQMMQTLPTEEQRKTLAVELKNHKSGVKQRDDITVVGVRV
jgi:serine/threonine protein phosphatase PrpC